MVQTKVPKQTGKWNRSLGLIISSKFNGSWSFLHTLELRSTSAISKIPLNYQSLIDALYSFPNFFSMKRPCAFLHEDLAWSVIKLSFVFFVFLPEKSFARHLSQINSSIAIPIKHSRKTSTRNRFASFKSRKSQRVEKNCGEKQQKKKIAIDASFFSATWTFFFTRQVELIE